MVRRAAIVAVACLVVPTAEVHAVRAIPDDNLAYPVLVSLNTGGTGSGFFLNTKDATYLVTARHVLVGGNPLTLQASTATLVSYPKTPGEEGRNEFRLDLSLLQTNGDIRWHSAKDAIVVKVARVAASGEVRTLETVPGVTLLRSAPSGVLGVARDTLKTLEKVLVANEVFVFGYPRSLGLKAMPQLDLERPLLRRGIVAGINPTQRSIVLDCPVYPGNSGGPVLEAEAQGLSRQFRIIGLVSEFVPFVETWVNTTHGWQNSSISNSGYSVVVPVDFILELLEQEKGT